jgi:hypothetical protein
MFTVSFEQPDRAKSTIREHLENWRKAIGLHQNPPADKTIDEIVADLEANPEGREGSLEFYQIVQTAMRSKNIDTSKTTMFLTTSGHMGVMTEEPGPVTVSFGYEQIKG